MSEWSILFRSFILLGATVGIAGAMRRASAATRHTVWCIGVIASLALPLASLLLPHLDLPLLPASNGPNYVPSNSVSDIQPTTTTLRSTPALSSAEEQKGSPESAGAPPSVSPAHFPIRNSQFPVLFLLWSAGGLVCIGRIVRGFLQVHELRQHSTRVHDERLLALLESEKKFRKSSSALQLRSSTDAIPPMTWGLLRHTLVLPSVATTWSSDRLCLVLAHELEHVKRRDGWFQLFTQIASAVYWPNPLIWYIARQMSIDRERACDDAILNRGESAEDYADHLLAIARGINSALVIPVLSMADRGHLEVRIRRILDTSQNRRSLSGISAGVLLLATIVLTTLIATATVTAFVMAGPSRPPAPMVPELHPTETLSPPAVRPTTTQRAAPSSSTAVLVGMQFMRIAPGTFLMGCSTADPDCKTDEKPSHRVRITRAFELGRYEVTQAQWQTMMGRNPSWAVGPDLPVEMVTWDDVQSFLTKLNDLHDGYRYRLPTEAEWEYAARAGSSGPIPDPLDSIAWYANNSGQSLLDSVAIWKTDRAGYGRRMIANGNQSHNAGQKQANVWGLYDMLGNVQELVQDWYDPTYYAQSPPSDPKGPDAGLRHVARGGWFYSSGLTSESTARVSSRTMALGESVPGNSMPQDPEKREALVAAVKGKDKAAIDAILRSVGNIQNIPKPPEFLFLSMGQRSIGVRVARDRL